MECDILKIASLYLYFGHVSIKIRAGGGGTPLIRVHSAEHLLEGGGATGGFFFWNLYFKESVSRFCGELRHPPAQILCPRCLIKGGASLSGTDYNKIRRKNTQRPEC